MTPIPATRHVSYGYDDDLAYEPGDPKSPGYYDEITDRAEEARS